MSTSNDAQHPRQDGAPQDAAAATKPERPSIVQTLAGALTAITVTYLMSFFGVAGTILGVGLVSVLTVLGNYMYSSVMHSAKEKVKQVQPKVKPRGETSHSAQDSFSARRDKDRHSEDLHMAGGHDDVAVQDGPDDSTEGPGEASPDSTDVQDGPDSTDGAGEDSQAGGRWSQAWRAMVDRYGKGRIIGSIALVFLLLGGTVTVVELAAGKNMSEIVRGEQGSGTTFFGGGSGGDGSEDDSDELNEQGTPAPEDGSTVDPGEQQDPAEPGEAPQEDGVTQDQPQDQQQEQPQEQQQEEAPAEDAPAEEAPAQ